MATAEWQRLDKALDDLERRGRTALMWWRDDDATEDTVPLRRLIQLSRRFDLPLLLAVIPAEARPNLASLLARTPTFVPAVHGFAHVNHAGPGQKKQELGGHRPAEAALADLAAGRHRLAALFGQDLAPVLVPPWNRIAPEVAARLPEIGFRGLSTFGAGDVTEPSGITVVNTHVDPIDWHGTRSLADAGALIRLVTAHVESCAVGEAPPALGLLTHHLVHDHAVWGFIETLFARTTGRPGIRWCEPRVLFGYRS